MRTNVESLGRPGHEIRAAGPGVREFATFADAGGPWNPLLQFMVLLNCQPPTRRSIALLASPKYFFPLPKGNSYKLVKTKTWSRLYGSGPYSAFGSMV